MKDPLLIDPGDLRHKITIQAPVTTGGTFGTGPKWSDVLTTRASLQQITAKTLYQSGALSTVASHKLRTRYTSTVIMPGYQVTFGSKTYRVVNVDNIQERNRVLELLLLEVNGAN